MDKVYISPIIKHQVAISEIENVTMEDFFEGCPVLTEEDLEKIAEHWDDEDGKEE